MTVTKDKVEEAHARIREQLQGGSKNVEILRAMLPDVRDIVFDWAVSRGLSSGAFKLNGVNLVLRDTHQP